MTESSPTDEPRSRRAPRVRRKIGRRGRRVLGLVVIAAIILVAATGADRTAADGRAGDRFEGPVAAAAPVARRLRLATFNLHGGRDADGRDAWDRAIDTLRGFDFIGLQEVRASPLGPGQAERAGTALAMPWCFAPSERRFWHGHFGNAALTTRPVRRWESVPLVNTRGKAYRNYLQVAIATVGGPVTVMVAHIDRQADRIAQLTHVGDVFLALPAPAILMGDLNTSGEDPGLRRVLDTPGVIDAHAGTLDPREHIDWILVRGLSVVEAGLVDLGASDHPCLWAEVEPAAR